MNWQILVSGATIAAVVFVMWYYLLNVLHYEERHAHDHHDADGIVAKLSRTELSF